MYPWFLPYGKSFEGFITNRREKNECDFFNQENLSLLIGAAAVCLVSGSMFNSWTKRYAEKFGYTDEPRHYTTFLRFNAYRTLYIIFMLIGYIVIIRFPDFILPAFGEQIPEKTKDLISKQINLWAALIITGFLPYFPGIRKGEGKLREWIQKKAFTPTKARTFIDILKNHAADFTNSRTDPLRHRWCKLSYLLTVIRNKKEDVEFSDYVECCDRQLFQKLEEEYEALSEDIDKIMDLVEAKPHDGSALDLVTSLKKEPRPLGNSALIPSCLRM